MYRKIITIIFIFSFVSTNIAPPLCSHTYYDNLRPMSVKCSSAGKDGIIGGMHRGDRTPDEIGSDVPNSSVPRAVPKSASAGEIDRIVQITTTKPGTIAYLPTHLSVGENVINQLVQQNRRDILGELISILISNSSESLDSATQAERFEATVMDFITADNGLTLQKVLSAIKGNDIHLSDINKITAVVNLPTNEAHLHTLIVFGEVEIAIIIEFINSEKTTFIFGTCLKPRRDTTATISQEEMSEPNMTAETGIVHGKRYHFVSEPFRLDDGAMVRYGLSDNIMVERLIIKGYARGLYRQVMSFCEKARRAHTRLVYRVLWEPLMKELGENGRILDLASGQGRHFYGIDRAGNMSKLPDDFEKRIIAVDYMKDALDEIEDTHPRIEAIQADWKSIPKQDASVNAVVGLNAISYVPENELGSVISELDRLLIPKADGSKKMIFLVDIVPGRYRFFTNRLLKARNPSDLNVGGIEQEQQLFLEMWKDDVRQAFMARGYKVEFEDVSETVILPAIEGVHESDYNDFHFGISVPTAIRVRRDEKLAAEQPGKVQERVDMLILRATKSASAGEVMPSEIAVKTPVAEGVSPKFAAPGYITREEIEKLKISMQHIATQA